MKLATWNVNSLAVRLPQLLDWLNAHQPDAIVLQETKLTDDKFPATKFEEAVYVLHCFQKKTQATSRQVKDIAVARYREVARARKDKR